MSIRQEGLILALRLYHVQLCATLKRFQTLALGPTTDIIVMTTIYITTRKNVQSYGHHDVQARIVCRRAS